MKKIIALLLVVVTLFALTACGQSKEAKAADDAIAAIGEVTLDSKESIETAERLVDALSEEDAAQLKKSETLSAAREKYNELEEESRAQKEADSVIQMINSISGADLPSCAKIIAAQTAYDGLSSTAKSKVSNYNKLNEAKNGVKSFLESEYNGAMSRMTIDNDEVRGISFYTPKQMPYYNNSRCCMLPYVGKSGNTAYLKLRFNYAGDDWVFFEQAIISVDGENYYKMFRYFDITHDNGGGMVGELIDVDPTDSDIEMLTAAITSNKTIVRFEGDDYYHDYTLSDNDKSAIRDALIVYYYYAF